MRSHSTPQGPICFDSPTLRRGNLRSREGQHAPLRAGRFPATNNKQMKTKTAAIKYARSRVSKLIYIGGNYFYRVFDDRCKAWRESRPQNYFAATHARSFALLCEALEYLHGEDFKMPAFYRGSWTDYVEVAR